jgi:5-methylcytosine-specific restriction endonuclease McrA
MPFRYLCPGCHRKQAMPGRCPECKREREHSRGTRQQRGYTDHWLRLVQLAIRTQPYCSNPDCRSTEDLTGDHIVPLSMGGTNTLENVQVLLPIVQQPQRHRGRSPVPQCEGKKPWLKDSQAVSVAL